MKIKHRILLSVIFIVGIFILVSIINIGSNHRVQKLNKYSSKVIFLTSNLNYIARLSRDLLISENFNSSYTNWRDCYINYSNEMETFLNDAVTINLFSTKEEKDLLLGLKESWTNVSKRLMIMDNTLSKASLININLSDGIISAKIESSEEIIILSKNIIKDNISYISDTLEYILGWTSDSIQKKTDKINIFTNIINITITIFIILIILFFFILLLTSINKPLRIKDTMMQKILKRDFSCKTEIKSKDEISELLTEIQKIVRVFSSVISDIRSIAEDANTVRNKLEKTSDNSKDTADKMIESINTIVNYVNKMFDMLKEAGTIANLVEENINTFAEKTINQSNSISNAVSFFENINNSISKVTDISKMRKESAEDLMKLTNEVNIGVLKTGELVKQTVNQTNEIADIVSVIQEISLKTNMLAMNAAIEAAHAGEYGKGFAVVATEVRKLAEKTNEHSKKIDETVKRITGSITGINTINEVTTGNFNTIMDEIKSSGESMNNILTSMIELSNNSEMIKDLMNRVSTDAIEITSESEKMSESIVKNALSLKNVGDFSNIIKESISDISKSALYSNDIILDINTLIKENNDSIEKLNNEVMKFKIE